MPTDTLILGASGFIGQHLARRLPGARCPDRAELDLSDPTAIAAALRTWRPRRIYNLAGYGARPGQWDPTAMHTLNALLPARLHEGLQALGGPRLLIQAGSVAEDLPSPYGRSKLAGSRLPPSSLVVTLHLRLFQVYGPGEAPGRLLPSLSALARGELAPPLALGDPKVRRDWIHVEDVAGLLLRLGEEERSGTVELGSGELHTVGEVVERACRLRGLEPSAFQWSRRDPGIPVPSVPADLRALRSRLGDLNLRSLDEGLAQWARA